MMKELSMHIMDIVQNSVRAEASCVSITVNENTPENYLRFSVEDNGKGMSQEFLQQVTDPFRTSRTTRRVGLGIPFLKQTCEQCGGRLTIESAPGKGTRLSAQMALNHIDRPPMGDLAESIFLLITMNPSVTFAYHHIVNDKEYVLDMKEVKEILGDMPLDTPEISAWLHENIQDGLTTIKQSS